MDLDQFRAGNGPPLVLLHGIWEGWHSWSPVLGRLSAEREVLALTLPDHLGSPPLPAGTAPSIAAWTDVVEAALDAAGFACPDIVGNSLGGWMALELAKRGRARTVVGVAPAGVFTPDEFEAFAKQSRSAHRQVRMVGPVAQWLVRRERGKRILMADNCADPTRIPTLEAQRLLAGFAFCDVPGQLASIAAAMTGPDGPVTRIEGLDQVRCPVLILHPTADRILTREHAERFLPELPGAELRELPDCGHTAMFDHPELVADEILRFTAPGG
jgi:pimeloyl-ACP methyl ester carboxylesterase